MGDRSDVVIIGGGVIGLATAYSMAREGIQVTLLERGRLGRECSYANAGLIVPSYCIPLATPRRLLEGVGMVVRRRAPISVELRPSRKLLNWLLRLAASSTPGRAAATTQLLSEFGRMSMALFKVVPGLRREAGFQQAGWLHLYRTEAGLARAAEEAGTLRKSAVPSVVLRPMEVREREPLAAERLAGGIHFPEEAHLIPDRFNALLARLAAEHGARLTENTEVTSLEARGGRVVAVLADGVEHRADFYVLAAGAWSPHLLKAAGLHLPLMAARGYSLDFPAPLLRLRLPLLLGEDHVVATPLGDLTRLTGGFELTRLTSKATGTRIEAIRRAPALYLSVADTLARQDPWFGFRPASPDGIPYVGPTNRYPNLLLATGHGTLGVTLSLATGRLLADLVRGRPVPPELRRVLPARAGL